MAHYEEDSMYDYQPRTWQWFCKVCNATATEGHCESLKHQKAVIFNLNKYRNPSNDLNVLSTIFIDGDIDPLELWGRHVSSWGLSIELVRSCFQAPGSLTPAHIVQFTFSNCAPSLDQTTSFWGNVFGFIRDVISELIQESERCKVNPQGLCVFKDHEAEWYNANVWSDADKHTTSTKKKEQETGLWWPCVVVDIGDGKVATYCQDFALQGAREVWVTDVSRVEPCQPPPPPPGPPPTVEPVESESGSDDAAATDASSESEHISDWHLEPDDVLIPDITDIPQSRWTMLEPN